MVVGCLYPESNSNVAGIGRPHRFSTPAIMAELSTTNQGTMMETVVFEAAGEAEQVLTWREMPVPEPGTERC